MAPTLGGKGWRAVSLLASFFAFYGRSRVGQQFSPRAVTMKLSRTAAYALHATLQLALDGRSTPVPSNQIAAKGKLPERFLLQVLRKLVSHGILQSTRGVDGGYTLARPPGKISLLEVIEAIDGPMDCPPLARAGLTKTLHGKLVDALEQATTTARSQLEAVKLSHLLPSAK